MSIIGPDRVVRQLHGYNPWWSGVAWDVPAFERLAVQKCLDWLLDPTSRRAVMLSGLRRVGKSTVLRQVAKRLIGLGHKPRSILYLSLDDNILRMVSIREILGVYRATVHPDPEPAILLLDEVHYARDWDLEVKHIVDHLPQYRVLATGSAAAEQRGRVADSGVGRWITIPIPTLSFFEYLRLRGEAPRDFDVSLGISSFLRADESRRMAAIVALRPTLPPFRRYLLVGGFPETARRSDVASSQQLIREDVVDRVLKRDMTALFGVRNVPDIERLFIYLCLHTGGTLVVARTAAALGLPRQTVDGYLDLLVQANLLYRLGPYETAGKKGLKPKQKYYLVDAGIRNAVLLSGEEVLSNPDEMGYIVETAVLRHLYAFYYKDTPRFSYWRDPKTDDEVDIVVSSPRYTIPVEVKYRAPRSDAVPVGLARFMQQTRAPFGVVVTQAEDDLSTHEGAAGVIRMPAHMFTYLLGSSERR